MTNDHPTNPFGFDDETIDKVRRALDARFPPPPSDQDKNNLVLVIGGAIAAGLAAGLANRHASQADQAQQNVAPPPPKPEPAADQQNLLSDPKLDKMNAKPAQDQDTKSDPSTE